MKIIRYLDRAGYTHYGSEQSDGSVHRIVGDIFDAYSVTAEPVEVIKLFAPVSPTQILCIGLNYRQHAVETDAKIPERPVLFVKGITALQHPGDPILLPRHLRSDEVDYECELAVVIGWPCKNVTRARALEYVLGYTCANDVSARDHQIRLGAGNGVAESSSTASPPWGPGWSRLMKLPIPMSWLSQPRLAVSVSRTRTPRT